MALTVEQQREIYKLAVGMYGAAPGVVYMNELASALNAGLSMTDIYNILSNTPGFQNQAFAYTNAASDAQFAEEFIDRLLGDTVTQANHDAAVDFVLGLIQGGATRGEAMQTAIDALDGVDESDPNFGAAAARFHNQIEVAMFYTEEANGDDTDIAVLQSLLAGVTEDDATVDQAIEDIENTASTLVFTDEVDNLAGTTGNDRFIGVTDTFNPGDAANGSTGDDTLSLLLEGGVYVGNTINNIESVELRPIGSSGTITLDMTDFDTSVQNVVIDRSNMDVNLVGAQNLFALTIDQSGHTVSIDFDTGVADGTDDTLALNISDSSVDVDIDSSDAVIENVSIDFTGENFLGLDAGESLARITVTGGGTNSLDIEDAADTLTIDAGAATGDNTFFLGGLLSDGDVVIGGSGADEVTGTLTVDDSGIAPTLSGVETVSLFLYGTTSETIDISLANADDVETLSLYSTDDLTINVMDADGSLANVDIGFFYAASHDLSIAYSNTATPTADLTVTFGGGYGSFTMDDLTVAGAASLAIVADDAEVDIDHLDIGGASTLALEAASSLDIDEVGTSDSLIAIDALNISVGDSGSVSADIFASDIGAIDATLGDAATLSLDITATLTSATATTDADYQGTLGDMTLGNINVAAGATADVDINITYYGWDSQTLGDFTVGDVTITAGDSSSIDFTVTASVDVSSTIGDATIGNITVTAGNSSNVSIDITHTGSTSSTVGALTVGDIAVTVGDSSSIDISLTASVSDTSTLGDMTVGNVTLTMGDSSTAELDIYYTGTDTSTDLGALTVGDITITGGANSTADISITASVSDTSTIAGVTVGDITVVVGEGSGVTDEVDVDVYFYGDTSATLGDMTVGDISVTAGDSTDVEVSITASISGTGSSLGNLTIGNITASVGASTSLDIDVYHAAYYSTNDLGALTIGDVTVTLGEGSNATLSLTHSHTGTGAFGDMTVGAIALTLNNADSISVDIDNLFDSGGTGSDLAVGDVTVVATSTASGDGSSDLYVGITNSASATDGGNLSVGDITLDLSRTAVTTGTFTATIDIFNYASDSLGDLTVGDITVNGDLGVIVDIDITNSGSTEGDFTVGNITLAGSTTVDITFVSNANTGTNDAVGVVDSTGLLGDLSLDLSLFDNGTTVNLGGGDDTLIGTSGDDVISGNTGIDSLDGGGGDDTYEFAQGDSDAGIDTGGAGTISASGIDLITGGFTGGAGTADLLDLSIAGNSFNYAEATITDQNASATVTYTDFVIMANAALDGTVRYFFGTDGTNGYLAISYNAATGVADEVIQINGITTTGGFDFSDIV